MSTKLVPLKTVFKQLEDLGCVNIEQIKQRSPSISCIAPGGIYVGCANARDLLAELEEELTQSDEGIKLYDRSQTALDYCSEEGSIDGATLPAQTQIDTWPIATQPITPEGWEQIDPSPIASNEVQPGAMLPIDAQLKIWSDNMPIFTQFPEEGNSAVYTFGWSENLINPEEQPRGVMLVFNARRGKVRAYPLSDRNYSRVSMLPIFEHYGRTHHSELSPNRSFVGSAPNGAIIPTNDCMLWVANGAIVCNRGVWGFITQGEHSPEFTQIELDWANAVQDRLRGNHLSVNVWNCAMRFFPNIEEDDNEATPAPTLEHSEPSQPRPYNWLEQIPYSDGLDWMGDYAAQLRADVGGEFDQMMVMTPAPAQPIAALWQPSQTQTNELWEQLVYWQMRRADYELIGDGDGEEFCSLYIVGLMAICANL